MAVTDTAAAINALTKEVKRMAEAQGAGFPTPTSEDAGKILGVDENGNWALIAPAASNDTSGDDTPSGNDTPGDDNTTGSDAPGE